MATATATATLCSKSAKMKRSPPPPLSADVNISRSQLHIVLQSQYDARYGMMAVDEKPVCLLEGSILERPDLPQLTIVSADELLQLMQLHLRQWSTVTVHFFHAPVFAGNTTTMYMYNVNCPLDGSECTLQFHSQSDVDPTSVYSCT